HNLVVLAVAPLQSGLQHLLRVLSIKRAKRVHFLRPEYQAFFAEYVLAGQKRVLCDGKVHVERSRHQDRIDVLVRKQLAIILERLRIRPDRLHALIDLLLLEIAKSDAVAIIDAGEVLQQVSAPAAGPDHSELDPVVGRPDSLDARKAFDLRGGSG